MFATVYKMQVKPGQEENLKALGEGWNRERAPHVPGFLFSYIIQNINKEGEFVGITVFDSQENFSKNASDPEQHQWYLKIRERLVSDPEWTDGPVVSAIHNPQPVS
jgi:antibiotic biosynthesis monooxygenase (ABM) superfamily enzyme